MPKERALFEKGGNMLDAAVGLLVGFFGPLLLGLVAVKLSGRPVSIKPILISVLVIVVYLTLITKAMGLIPEPAFLPPHKLNWYGKILAIAGTLAMIALLPGVNFKAVGFTFKQNEGSLGPVLVTAVVTCLAVWALRYFYFPGPNTSAENLIYQAIVPGLDEEPLFRGLALLLLHQGFSRNLKLFGAETGWGLIIMTLSFGFGHGVRFADGALHFEWVIIAFTGTLGFIFGWMRERTGSLVLPVLVHNAVNFGGAFL